MTTRTIMRTRRTVTTVTKGNILPDGWRAANEGSVWMKRSLENGSRSLHYSLEKFLRASSMTDDENRTRGGRLRDKKVVFLLPLKHLEWRTLERIPPVQKEKRDMSFRVSHKETKENLHLRTHTHGKSHTPRSTLNVSLLTVLLISMYKYFFPFLKDE